MDKITQINYVLLFYFLKTSGPNFMRIFCKMILQQSLDYSKK